VRPVEAVEGDVDLHDRREAAGGGGGGSRERAGERVRAEVEHPQAPQAGHLLRRGAAKRVPGEVERGEGVEGGERGGDAAVEALVGEIQRDHPPEIAGDARPGTAGGAVAVAPPDEPGGFAVQAIGEGEERLQVGGVARLGLQGGTGTDDVEQRGDEQEVEQPAEASHLRRQAVAGSGKEAVLLPGMNDRERRKGSEQFSPELPHTTWLRCRCMHRPSTKNRSGER